MHLKKISSIIMKECGEIEERCKGYREALIDVITDILEDERQHLIQGRSTNIQKKVNDKCNAVGRFLAEKRSH